MLLTHPPRLARVIDDAHLGGFFLTKIPYNKPPLSLDDMLDRLEKRGMEIPDIARAKYYLAHIGYYRLSGYWFTFQMRHDPQNHNQFRPGTSFDTILDRYIFDRKLRIMIMDAVERIEIAARTAISDVMSLQYGAHWYQQNRHFTCAGWHSTFLVNARREAGVYPNNLKRQSQCVRHYIDKYEPIDPPCWMLFEVISFGKISYLYQNLHNADKNAIAERFDMPRKILESWLHAASYIRNLAAHHNRVWNHEFRIAPKIANAHKGHIQNPKRFYSYAVILHTLLQKISSRSQWGHRLNQLFAEYPEIPLRDMGFPDKWHEHNIWRNQLVKKNAP